MLKNSNQDNLMERLSTRMFSKNECFGHYFPSVLHLSNSLVKRNKTDAALEKQVISDHSDILLSFCNIDKVCIN